MTAHLGHLASTGIPAMVFAAMVVPQIRARLFEPWLSSGVIVATTASFADRSLGIGHPGGAARHGAVRRVAARGRISANDIVMPRVQVFSWATILFSNTLGTALGDFLADGAGAGSAGGP